ncbi:hypothetical protein MKW94_010659 [Papaver nudicaule]|uniref:Uncharacterized protein n=1 Tax=Papaver nudicaule TaxID=74823 RepID=A0AA41V2Z0_PAPNU|nr:hypothetical protein [Papaver nudicaule]
MLINQLKSKCNNDEIWFSTYEVIAGHVWRCSCKARELKDDKKTTILVPFDNRSRSSPPLPNAYFGNAVFCITPTATSGELISKPLSYAVSLIHETLMASANDEYFRSALDFLELHPSIPTFKSSSVSFSSWVRLPIYEADFGWGQPLYMGPCMINTAGRSFLIPNPPGSDDGFTLVIPLESQYHTNLFKKYFYDI